MVSNPNAGVAADRESTKLTPSEQAPNVNKVLQGSGLFVSGEE